MTTQINYPNCIINISDNSGNYTILKNDSITLGGLKIYTNSSSLGANIMEVTSTNINFSNLLSGITQYREYGYSTIYKNINASGNINQGTYNNDSIKFNNNQSGLNISTTVTGTTLDTTNAYNIKSSNDISINATNINLTATNYININSSLNINYNSIINYGNIDYKQLKCTDSGGTSTLNGSCLLFANDRTVTYSGSGITTYNNSSLVIESTNINLSGNNISFINSPTIPEPTTSTHAASKNYVDSILTKSSAWSGINTFSNTNYFTTIDSNAAILNIGTTSATRTNIGRTNIVTNINGSLLINGSAALTNQVLTTTGWLDRWTATSNLSMAGYYITTTNTSIVPYNQNYIGSAYIPSAAITTTNFTANITFAIASYSSIASVPIGNYILSANCRVLVTGSGTITYVSIGAGTTTAMEYGSTTLCGNTNTSVRPFDINFATFIPLTGITTVNLYVTALTTANMSISNSNTSSRLIKIA
jgi:hypothetical protein